MRVMVTGGTGFVGYHTVLALLEAGHEVSLLVRSEQKMNKLFGAGVIEQFTCGDITDKAAVVQSLAKCDAVIHSAAMVSTGADDAELVYETNYNGTRTVIDAALDQGVEQLIHVSSVTALFNPDASVLDEHSPPGSASSGYGRSKVASEKYVRDLQDNGAPIFITYPATVIGPDDPGLTESHEGLKTYLTTFVPVMVSGNQYVDVRDVAEAHLRLLEQPVDFGRYILGGHFLPWKELGGVLEDLTGRQLFKVPLSAGLMRFAGRVFDRLEGYVSLDIPLTEEAMGYATRWVLMDNSKAERELGIEFRPLEESMADAIVWLYEAGHITAEKAGKALVGR